MSAPIRPAVNPPVPPMDPAAGLPVGYPLRPEWEVTPRQVAESLRSASDKPLILDCRRDEEFAFNRLPGDVVHIEMNQIERRADELEGEGGRRDERIVVYCHHGRRSQTVTQALRAMGFSNVHSMAGGIDAWSLGVDQCVPRY